MAFYGKNALVMLLAVWVLAAIGLANDNTGAMIGIEAAPVKKVLGVRADAYPVTVTITNCGAAPVASSTGEASPTRETSESTPAGVPTSQSTIPVVGVPPTGTAPTESVPAGSPTAGGSTETVSAPTGAVPTGTSPAATGCNGTGAGCPGAPSGMTTGMTSGVAPMSTGSSSTMIMTSAVTPVTSSGEQPTSQPTGNNSESPVASPTSNSGAAPVKGMHVAGFVLAAAHLAL